MIWNYENFPTMLLIFSDQAPEEADMTKGIGGPFLQMAVFCERVLQEKDGVISAIRIVDRFTQVVPPTSAQTVMVPMRLDVFVVIAIKSGDFKRKAELKITPKTPSGEEMPGFSGSVLLEGDERGVNVIIRYVFESKEEGVYWFDVELDGQSLTKMPLHIIHQEMPTSSTTSSVELKE